MQYFIYPILLLVYFELFGRVVLYKFNRKPFEFSFIVGFASIMGILFITIWPITSLNQSFYLLLAVMVLLFLMSIILIMVNIKNISFKINYKWWIIFIILFVFQTYISATRTLGEVHGFDTLYYLNMIEFNIGNHELNSLHPHFGTYPNTDIQWFTYVFQSFYYFIPVIIYIFRFLFDLVGISFETLPAYIWGMQILCNAIFVATGLVCINQIKSKSKLLDFGLIILLVLFMNNFYFNNSFGFIGNNFRMSLHAVSTIVLFDYFKNYEKKDLFLFILIQLGICGIASTGTFAIVFVLFTLFFILFDKESNLLKYYAIVLYVPLVTILVTKFEVQAWIYIVVFILCVLVYLLNDFILKIYQNKYIRYGTIALVTSILIIGSAIMSKQIISLHFFFNNYSEIADMSWDYFMFNDISHWIFNSLILIPLAYYLFKNKKEPFAIMCFILIVTFFNPLGSFMMNTINWVYYRAYDIIINQYTIALFIVLIYKAISKDDYKKLYTLIIIILSSILAIIQIPKYFHYSFEVYDDYNYLYKISNYELEVIRNVERMIEDYQIENPSIITSTFYMPAFIEDSTYLFGKEKRYDTLKYDDISYALYLILFPVDYVYDNFRPDIVPDYENTVKYLNECDYDILVVRNDLFYEDLANGSFHPITELIEEDGTYQKSEYSTAAYAVYYLGNN